VHVRVAGLTIQLTCDEAALQGLRVAPSRAYTPFLVPASPADVVLTAEARDLSGESVGECLFDSGGPWQLHRDRAGFAFRFLTPALGPTPYKTANLKQDFSAGRISLHHPFFAGRAPVDPLEYPLDELLIISLLAQGRGIEIHGCGVVHEGKGYLFAGQSGAGKSTIARLWMDEHDALVLSDDRVILRGDGGRFWIHGTPWHGEAPLASPGCAPLAAVLFLRQHDQNGITPLRPADAVARLVAASFPPFYDREALSFSLTFLQSVVARTPSVEFCFAPTKAAVAAVTSALF